MSATGYVHLGLAVIAAGGWLIARHRVRLAPLRHTALLQP